MSDVKPELAGISRRQFLKIAGMLGAAMTVRPVFPIPRALAQENGDSLARSVTRVRGFSSDEMDFQLLRQLGSTDFGGSSVGESLAIARDIDDGVPASWSKAFARLARFQLADAEAREARGHRVSAREQYLKASNSFRAAEYFTPFDDPQRRDLGLKSRNAFSRSMRLQDHTFEEVRLTFDGIWLPAYFLRPSGNAGSTKTILIISGYDGTLEESYFMGGRAALERGYNVLLIAGPGQADTARFFPQRPFIPEYERVVSLAVDYALARPDVDRARLGLLGLSYGGYFATRAAAYEPRVKALIANSPIIDLHRYMVAFIGADPLQMPADMDFKVADIPYIPDDILPPLEKQMAASLILRFGRETFTQTYQYLKEFRVDRLEQIRCPALGLVGAGEGEEPTRQYNQFLRRVSGPAQGYTFQAIEGADSHSSVGNLRLAAAVTFDWLDEIFDGSERAS